MTTPIATGVRNVLLTFSRRTVASRTDSRDIASYTWTELGTRWARVQMKGGGEREFGGQTIAIDQLTATFPYFSGLTTEDKITISGTDYGIDILDDRDMAGIEHVATIAKLDE